MKKVFLVAILPLFLKADAPHTVANSIEFRPTLKMFQDTNFSTQILLPKNENFNKIVRSIVQMEINFNGFVIPTKGTIHTFPSITIKQLSDILFDFKFTHVLFKDGIVTGEYSLEQGPYGQPINLTLSTEPYVTIYQCPFAQTITVKDQQETGLVLIESVPECTALDMNQNSCKQHIAQYYCARNALKKTDKKDLYHQESMHGQLHKDETDQHKGPMYFKIINYKGSDKIYTYQLESFFGPLVMDSPLQERNLIASQVTDPDKVSILNRGFAVDDLKRPVDHNGNLIIPPCSSMSISKVSENLLCLRCIYGNNQNSSDNFILERIVAHQIDSQHCVIADTLTQSPYNCAEKLLRDKKVELSCIDKNGKQIPPPLIVCKK